MNQDRDVAETAEEAASDRASTVTVVVALIVNLAIAGLKAFAGVFTGSAAMLSEAAHSVADTFTEVFLLTALHRSARPADRWHPFGYGKERYFWSLLAAVSIFASGAVFAFVEGVRTITGEAAAQQQPVVGYAVLAFAFLLEGSSWWRSLRQLRAEARETGYPLLRYLWLIDDPAPKTVLYEDSAALVGLVLAALGLMLHQITGLAVFDGVASLLIGLLLGIVAFTLGYSNQRLLIGSQAHPALMRAIYRWLADRKEVDAVVDLLTMSTGADKVLLCARLDFDNNLTVAQLERACVQLDDELRGTFGDLDEIFLEPVPRTDQNMRDRVLARYGPLLTRLNARTRTPPRKRK